MLLILKDKRKSAPDTEKTVSVLQKKLTKRGLSVDIASFEDIELFIKKGEVRAFVKNKPFTDYRAIFFRRVGKKRSLAFILSNIAQKNGMFYVDRLYRLTSEPGKLKQTAALALNGISTPKTYFASIYTKKSIDSAEKFLGLPMVIKISRSRKGAGVFLAKSKKEALRIIKDALRNEILIQEFIPNNFDYRVLILGNALSCVIKRERPDKTNEFRNNVYLGASEEFMDIPEVSTSIKKEALRAAQVADIQVAGVDIVIGPDNKPYVFEINRSPAFTFDEKISNELGLLAEYLYQCHKKEK